MGEAQRAEWARLENRSRRNRWIRRALQATAFGLAAAWWACAFYGAWTLLARWFGGGE
jgi:hypothetical protein